MNVFDRSASSTIRVTGVLLALALVFSGDLVRIHGHADGAPTNDCVACVAGLAAAAAADPPPALDPPPASTLVLEGASPRLAPPLAFVRQGGLRDPPVPSA